MTDVLAPAEAHVIADDAEAIAVAHRLADAWRPGAADRDRERRVPREELAQLARSGLLGITVPRSHGGAEVSAETLAEVFRILASGDPAVGQVPQNHFVFVGVLIADGTPEQQSFFFDELLRGARFGNALSERGTKHVMDLRTRVRADPAGGFRVDGRKYYCTGALTAQWIPVFALDDAERLVVAYVERDAPGVHVDEDWTAMGQRSTISGTATFTDVWVPADRVVPHWRTYERAQVFGAFGQLLHAAIDVGIAGNALDDAAAFVRERSRPWFESGVDRASDEPLVIARFGELTVRLRAAEALLARAGRAIDHARASGVTEETAAAASLAVAEAKVLASEVAVEIGSELFALAGTSATDARWDLDRHWRNARTHTLHDPSRWKLHHIGNATLNGVRPPNHGLL
ncbi:MAG TPA: SfnB family sulfur acquisition oxidoreductase [Capillimicrobium sp.]|nr:SfnB family sulfur acquisition oxidoreductase [Capillimicrobium sp.]